MIELLCGRLERSGEASLLRAHAAVAAARLLDGDSALAPARERLVRAALAASRDADARVQRGALLALGQVCTGAESELDLAARSVLRLACEESAEPLTRRQALLGYARSCARPGPGDARTRAEARGFLLERLDEGPTEERAWAALACALFARTRAEAGAAPAEVGELHAALRARLGGEKAEECQAALSIAAALAGDVQSVPALRERLHGSSDERTALRIEALGVLGDRLAVADVRPFLVEWAARPELLRSAAEALGRLGDEDAAPTLLRLLAETPSGYAKAGIAWALGHFDDGRSVPALAALLGDRTQFGGARAFAAIALGRIGSGEDRPWNARFGLDLDPTAALPTLCDPLGGGGLLDIQ